MTVQPEKCLRKKRTCVHFLLRYNSGWCKMLSLSISNGIEPIFSLLLLFTIQFYDF
jgi:hypothetical protein